MNYYEIYDRYSDELLTRGNAAECRKALGCASLDSFYALANRARRGINKKYRVVIKKGGQVAIDFDGCLCANAYPDIGAPNWEIIVAAAAEQIAGAGLILWTCREGELLENALEACARWGLHFDAVNDSLPSWKKFYGNETRKVGATEYWDDKAYRVQNGKLMKEAAHEMD